MQGRAGFVAALVAFMFEVFGAAHAEANLASRCRRYCASAVNECSLQGEPRRRCRRRYLRLCKFNGFTACDLTPATTTTIAPPTTTTTYATTSTTFRATTTTTQPDRLSLLLGNWAFTYTIISTYTDHYNLSTIQQATGHSYNVVFGTNSDLGNSVIAGRVQDIDPGSTSGYEFALLDPESSLCEFFAFNVGGASSASGVVLFFYGDCQTPISGTLYNFRGIKY